MNVNELRQQEHDIRQGGGTKAIARQHEKGRLTARERIARLLDPGVPFFELGLWAAWGMYADWGGAPAAGVVTGAGRVSGRLVMVVANDATVKAGAFFPMTVKKVLRAQRVARENRLPLVGALPHDRTCVAHDRPPGRPPADVYALFGGGADAAGGRPAPHEYDVRDLLPCFLDAGPFDEYKAEYGQTLVCGYGRLGGVAVGVVANQRKRCKPAAGPLQYGGVIYVDAADKAARFIMDCNQTRVSLVFRQDVNGFMVGRDS